jgi:hypothetical protein
LLPVVVGRSKHVFERMNVSPVPSTASRRRTSRTRTTEVARPSLAGTAASRRAQTRPVNRLFPRRGHLTTTGGPLAVSASVVVGIVPGRDLLTAGRGIPPSSGPSPVRFRVGNAGPPYFAKRQPAKPPQRQDRGRDGSCAGWARPAWPPHRFPGHAPSRDRSRRPGAGGRSEAGRGAEPDNRGGRRGGDRRGKSARDLLRRSASSLQ